SFRGRAAAATDPLQGRDLLGLRVPGQDRRRAAPLPPRRWRAAGRPAAPERPLLVAALPHHPGLADGALPRVRHDPRAQRAVRRWRAVPPLLPLALLAGEADATPAHPVDDAPQPP